MPNHEILPFVGSWESTDALHCRVKGIPDLSLMEFNVGDINQDNIVNVLDVVTMVQFILNFSVPNDYQFELADINQDGVLDVLDIVSLAGIILN